MSAIAPEERDEYGEVGDKRKKIGSRTVYRPVLEYFELNLRSDRIKAKYHGAARDWWLWIAHECTTALENRAKREAAVRATRNFYEAHWRKLASG